MLYVLGTSILWITTMTTAGYIRNLLTCENQSINQSTTLSLNRIRSTYLVYKSKQKHSPKQTQKRKGGCTHSLVSSSHTVRLSASYKRRVEEVKTDKEFDRRDNIYLHTHIKNPSTIYSAGAQEMPSSVCCLHAPQRRAVYKRTGELYTIE